MSVEGPKPYIVVYDVVSGSLQYSFQDGWYPLPASAGGITQLTGPVTAGPGAGSVATTITPGAITPATISTTGTDNFTFPANVTAKGNMFVNTTASGQNALLTVGDGSAATAQVTVEVANHNQAVLELLSSGGQAWELLLQVDNTFIVFDGTNSVVCQTIYPHGGVAPTKLTTTAKNALTAVEGMVVYDTTLHKLSVYTGSAWETVTSA